MSTTTHTLTFATPTWRDYLNGGFGDLIAQCSCNAAYVYEYVFTELEGAWWHSLHTAQPRKHPHYLTLEAPMAEGWKPAEPEEKSATVVAVPAQPRYTCPQCMGARAVEAEGAWGGRFYHPGDRVTCGRCAGVGSVEDWMAA